MYISYMLPYGYCTYSQNILVDNSGVYLYSTCVPTCSQRCEPNSTTRYSTTAEPHICSAAHSQHHIMHHSTAE